MLAVWVGLGLLLAAALAVALPHFLVRYVGWGIWQRSRRTDGVIGLSFDDGPNPVATPIVLDILARAGVHATFFVSGDAVDAHPELVRRLVAEGHEVASHGYHHKDANFGRWPLTGFFDTLKAIRRLEAVVGRTRFYRGPYGNYSWSVLAALRICGVQPVNWSIEARDWHPQFTPETVCARVLEQAHPGGVICMHDGGRGSKRSVHALEPVLVGLAAQQFRVVPLTELWP